MIYIISWATGFYNAFLLWKEFVVQELAYTDDLRNTDIYLVLIESKMESRPERKYADTFS